MLATRSRRPGRRWHDPDEAERLKHIRAAALLLSRKYSPEGIAALHGVSVRTIYRWLGLALTYDEPEAEGLRRVMARRDRRRFARSEAAFTDAEAGCR